MLNIKNQIAHCKYFTIKVLNFIIEIIHWIFLHNFVSSNLSETGCESMRIGDAWSN